MTREEAIEAIKEAYGNTEYTDEIIKALEPTWIPVSERLPEPNRLVLCYITTGTTKTYFLALWNPIQNTWEEGIGGCRLLERDLGYEVIAWMNRDIPEPYKAESEGQYDRYENFNR